MAGRIGGKDMRLICSSCGAQYEVDDSVIPETGRDVQCSNCGHTWFQMAALQLTSRLEAGAPEPAKQAASATPEKAEDKTADDPVDEPASPEEAPVGAVPADTPDDRAPDDDEARDDEADDPEEAAQAPSLVGAMGRRKLDESVRNVLQEEAEREVRVRKSESEALESQPDLGLSPAASLAGTAAEARDRVVRVRGDEDDLDEDGLTTRAARRELLPDIEEINSTLRATSERGDEAAARDAPEALAARNRSGFRRGFSLAVLISALAVALYLLAPVIAETVPALEPALAAYVTAMDSARAWLDETMKSLTAAIKGAEGG